MRTATRTIRSTAQQPSKRKRRQSNTKKMSSDESGIDSCLSRCVFRLGIAKVEQQATSEFALKGYDGNLQGAGLGMPIKLDKS